MLNFTQEQQFESALKLHGRLQGLGSRAFGYFMGGKLELCNNLHIPNHPERSTETRNELRELMEGLSLVYLFALWDEHIQSDYFIAHVDKGELRKFRAFKHVRHTVAHGISGKRAMQCRNEFEAEMPFSGIALDVNSDSISIGSSSVTLGCLQLMSHLSGKLAAQLYQIGFNPSP